MIPERIKRAQWLLNNILHAAMATVNEDGTPHNTPYLFMRSDDLSELYWCSSPKSLHSQNVKRTGNIFVVLYEANERGGLFIRCHNAREAVGAELERALTAHNKIRSRFSKEPLELDYYTGDSPQRMYLAEPQTFWVNYSDRDAAGQVIEDKRAEITKADLIV